MLDRTAIDLLRNKLLQCLRQHSQLYSRYSRHHQDNRWFSRFNNRRFSRYQQGREHPSIGNINQLWLKLFVSTWCIIYNHLSRSIMGQFELSIPTPVTSCLVPTRRITSTADANSVQPIWSDTAADARSTPAEALGRHDCRCDERTVRAQAKGHWKFVSAPISWVVWKGSTA